MRRYSVEFRPAALRALRKLDPDKSERIRKALVLLSHDPRPPASVPMKGRDGYRLRIGDYRVIYAIEDDRLVVLVIALGHRRDVYR